MLEEEPDVVEVEIKFETLVILTFANGMRRIMDLKAIMAGPACEDILNNGDFDKIYVDKEAGTICWPNGADIAPEVLAQAGIIYLK